jgi:hypothetical protein
MLLAKWSLKGAVEYEQYMRFAPKIGQLHGFTLEILQGEIGGGGVE